MCQVNYKAFIDRLVEAPMNEEEFLEYSKSWGDTVKDNKRFNWNREGYQILHARIRDLEERLDLVREVVAGDLG